MLLELPELPGVVDELALPEVDALPEPPEVVEVPAEPGVLLPDVPEGVGLPSVLELPTPPDALEPLDDAGEFELPDELELPEATALPALPDVLAPRAADASLPIRVESGIEVPDALKSGLCTSESIGMWL